MRMFSSVVTNKMISQKVAVSTEESNEESLSTLIAESGKTQNKGFEIQYISQKSG